MQIESTGQEPPYRTGTLTGLTHFEAQRLLPGIQTDTRTSANHKITLMWRFLADEKRCEVWNYRKGNELRSEFSMFGPDAAFDAPLLSYVTAPALSLQSETASFPRSQPPLARRRPSTTSRQDRALSQAPSATPAVLPLSTAPTPPFTCGCRLHSAPRVRENRDRSLERGMSAGLRPPLPDTLSRRAAGGARSRCAARAFVVSRATP
jgi:hypothetical protein